MIVFLGTGRRAPKPLELPWRKKPEKKLMRTGSHVLKAADRVIEASDRVIRDNEPAPRPKTTGERQEDLTRELTAELEREGITVKLPKPTSATDPLDVLKNIGNDVDITSIRDELEAELSAERGPVPRAEVGMELAQFERRLSLIRSKGANWAENLKLFMEDAVKAYDDFPEAQREIKRMIVEQADLFFRIAGSYGAKRLPEETRLLVDVERISTVSRVSVQADAIGKRLNGNLDNIMKNRGELGFADDLERFMNSALDEYRKYKPFAELSEIQMAITEAVLRAANEYEAARGAGTPILRKVSKELGL